MKKNILRLLICILFFSGNAWAEESGTPLHGFADAVGGTSSKDSPENQRLRGVSVGTIDMYLTPEFEGGVKSLMEIAFEPGSADGAIGVDVERIQVGYELGDSATIWMGRFHTPYGYWNTGFHHGAQLQTSIYRPRFVDFEDKGGILPAHTVGLWLHGSTKVVGDNRFVYDLYSGNGPRILNAGSTSGSKAGGLDPNLIRADRAGAMTGANLGIKFADTLSGLVVGLHGFTTPVNSYAGDGNYENNRVAGPIAQSSVNMTGAYVFYEGDYFDLDAEYYSFSTKNYDMTNSIWSSAVGSSAYFAQLSGNMGSSHPFVRVENLTVSDDPNNSYLNNQENARSNNRTAVGFRYDVNTKAAMKLEFIHTAQTEKSPNDISYDKFAAQYAIRF